MKTVVTALSASILLAACGQVSDNSTCDLTSISTKVAAFPNEQARAKAEEHLKLAREARDKKDAAACEAHKKQAEEALKL
jgi:hypothetical protein